MKNHNEIAAKKFNNVAQHGLYTALAKPRWASGKFSSSLRRALISIPANQAQPLDCHEY